MRFVPLVFIVVALIQGCASYRTVGSLTGENDIFYGQITGNILDGSAKVKLSNIDGSVICSGESVQTKYGLESLFGCKNNEGTANLACSDSRKMVANWVADTCTQGVGSGYDTFGNRFNFVYGGNDKDAANKIKQILFNTGKINYAALEAEITSFSKTAYAQHRAETLRVISEDLKIAFAISSVLLQQPDLDYLSYLKPSPYSQLGGTSAGSTIEIKRCDNNAECGENSVCVKMPSLYSFPFCAEVSVER